MEPAGEPGDLCPWCDYDLRGIERVRLCPECGRGLSPESRAMAERGQARGRERARLVLLASPLGVVAALLVGVVAAGRGVWFVTILGGLILGLSGFVALYFGRRRDRRNWKEAALGALPLGIAYFVGAVAVAIVVCLILVAFMR